jgi:hypothetical protein
VFGNHGGLDILTGNRSPKVPDLIVDIAFVALILADDRLDGAFKQSDSGYQHICRTSGRFQSEFPYQITVRRRFVAE